MSGKEERIKECIIREIIFYYGKKNERNRSKEEVACMDLHLARADEDRVQRRPTTPLVACQKLTFCYFRYSP
jgi:hypothetical protein